MAKTPIVVFDGEATGGERKSLAGSALGQCGL
jgi:hypothetical protein